MKRIVLDGNICSGKTYYLNRLKQHLISIELHEGSQPDAIKLSPDAIIYLSCHPLVCYQRVLQRSPHNNLTLDDLKQSHLIYEKMYDVLNCPIRIYKVNSQQDPETVYNTLKQIIEKEGSKIQGLS
jgi:thymidylate kinase